MPHGDMNNTLYQILSNIYHVCIYLISDCFGTRQIVFGNNINAIYSCLNPYISRPYSIISHLAQLKKRFSPLFLVLSLSPVNVEKMSRITLGNFPDFFSRWARWDTPFLYQVRGKICIVFMLLSNIICRVPK